MTKRTPRLKRKQPKAISRKQQLRILAKGLSVLAAGLAQEIAEEEATEKPKEKDRDKRLEQRRRQRKMRKPQSE